MWHLQSRQVNMIVENRTFDVKYELSEMLN